jgi:hypothetical protein
MSTDGMVSSDNLRTLVLVAFVLSLLSMVFNIINYRRVDAAVDGAVSIADVDASMHAGLQAQLDPMNARIDAVEKRVAAIESAPPPAVPPPAPAPK